MNSPNFYLSKNVLIWPLFLKEVIIGYRLLSSQVLFPLSPLKLLFNCLLASLVSNKLVGLPWWSSG